MTDELQQWADETISRAREVTRDAIFRITLLSASIVAFSATLLSIEQIDLRGDQTLLTVSWGLFAAVVVLGPLLVALEARAQYVLAWRAVQPQDFDDVERAPTLVERAKLLGVLAYSLVIRPRNLIYARLSDYNEKPTQGMWMNFRMVLLLHTVYDIALALEIFVWLLFGAAVTVMVIAIAP